MDAIAEAKRRSFQMRGRSYVAFILCPAVPIVGWLQEIDVTRARSPGFFAGKPIAPSAATRPRRNRPPCVQLR